MTISIVTEMPTTGQFAMVHSFEDGIWGSSYRYNEEGKLQLMDIAFVDDTPVDAWVDVDNFEDMHKDITILGYVVEEA